MPHSFAHIGEELKNRRLERGETLSAIAKRLRISVTYLNAIEELDADSFPALSYGIGYARSYANVLGMPADAVVERFKADLSIRKIAAYQGPKQRVKQRRFMLPKGIISGAAVTILAASLVGWFGVHAEDQIEPSSTLTAVADIDVRAEAPLPSDMYRLTAVGPSWVEIRLPDNVLIRRILTPGERWEGAVQSGLTIMARNGHALHLQRGEHDYGSLTNRSQRLEATSFDALEARLSAKIVGR
ncbi:MAG: helix-turn-helix domain-containing protein [Maricaulaceae bacterium]